MTREITINNLLPEMRNSALSAGKTYVGIDFGTSTTVVSISTFSKDHGLMTITPQMKYKTDEGIKGSSEKIPTCVAWKNGHLLFGNGAAEHKFHLEKDKNIWYSFKMDLGEDKGAIYSKSELAMSSGEKFVIETPKDVTRYFFRYLKKNIESFVNENGFPSSICYAVSIPASFEANQRRDLLQVLEDNGIDVSNRALIDEPNAAFISCMAGGDLGMKAFEEKNPRLLVFDYGAGTCDISILEFSLDAKGMKSRNIAISKYARCGGDDIDKYIARHLLYPQFLKQNNLLDEDFIRKDRQRIIEQLRTPAEIAKITLCKNVAVHVTNGILPALASSDEKVSIKDSWNISLNGKDYSFSDPSVSYAEFNSAMSCFLSLESMNDIPDDDHPESIFSQIESAIEKSGDGRDSIDYVLLIGGSSYNPYVQFAISEYFHDASIIKPANLQAHVSKGVAIHSMLLNAFGHCFIQPIISDPIGVVTRDAENQIIIPAGTQMPCDNILLDNLVVVEDGQTVIELPIFSRNESRILHVVRIENDKGFKKGDKVKISGAISSDKLLSISACVNGEHPVVVNMLNPFSNDGMSAGDQAVFAAQRKVNNEAVRNGGRASVSSMKTLAQAYHDKEDYLSEAETYIEINQGKPGTISDNEIGVAYSNAGDKKNARKYYELDHKKNPGNSTSAFNLACNLDHTEKDRYVELMEKAIRDDDPCHLFEYGRWLTHNGERKRGNELIDIAMEAFEHRYAEGRMKPWDYSWYVSALRLRHEYAKADEVRKAGMKTGPAERYNTRNLVEKQY